MDSEFLNKTPQANNISQKTDLFDYLKINNFVIQKQQRQN